MNFINFFRKSRRDKSGLRRKKTFLFFADYMKENGIELHSGKNAYTKQGNDLLFSFAGSYNGKKYCPKNRDDAIIVWPQHWYNKTVPADHKPLVMSEMVPAFQDFFDKYYPTAKIEDNFDVVTIPVADILICYVRADIELKQEKNVSSAVGNIKNVKFTREYREDTSVWRVYNAPCKADAVAFLSEQTVTRPSYYIIVETPEGNFGRDENSIYHE